MTEHARINRVHVRHRMATLNAMQYDGDFPLDFLEDGESVRAVPGGRGAVIVETVGGTPYRVEVGDWIVRGAMHELLACTDAQFHDRFEVVGA